MKKVYFKKLLEKTFKFKFKYKDYVGSFQCFYDLGALGGDGGDQGGDGGGSKSLLIDQTSAIIERDSLISFHF